MQNLLALDEKLFLLVNGLHSPVFDFIFWWISDRFVWIPFYVFLLYLYIRAYGRKSVYALLVIGLLILLCDQTASAFLKNYVMRLRPCHVPGLAEQVHLVNGYCGGAYGFVSSHAANSFGLATFFWFTLGKRYRAMAYVLITWSVLILYSRVYLGVHYPGDVLCGAAIGWFYAWILQQVFRARVLPLPVETAKTI